MADVTLSPTGLIQPEEGASEDTWGDKWNTNADTLNDLFDDVGGDPALKVENGGTGKVVPWLALGARAGKTIASDTIAATGPFLGVSPQSGTADNLQTITGGSEGDIIVVACTAGNTITIKHAIGNIICGSDFVMDSTADNIVLMKYSTFWMQLSRANNADAG